MDDDIKTEMLGEDMKISFIKLLNYIDGLEKRIEELESGSRRNRPLGPGGGARRDWGRGGIGRPGGAASKKEE